jgi:hypothetical protein
VCESISILLSAERKSFQLYSDTKLLRSPRDLIPLRYPVQIGSTQEQPSLEENVEPKTNHNTPTKVHVVCDVRAQYGSKVVIIQSPIVIENHTNMDLEVGLDIPPVVAHPGRAKEVNPNVTRPRPLVPLATLPPHSERAPLPLSRVSTAKLRLRPVAPKVNIKVPDESVVQIPPLDMPSSSVVGVVPSDVPPQEYGWSVNVIDLWDMKAGSDSVVRCGPGFCCRVVVHRKSPNLVIKVSTLTTGCLLWRKGLLLLPSLLPLFLSLFLPLSPPSKFFLDRLRYVPLWNSIIIYPARYTIT